MKYSIEINKIIEGAIKLDKVKVENYTKLLIEKLINDDDTKAAKKLSDLLQKHTDNSLTGMSISKIFKTPVDSESRIPMADIIMPNDGRLNVVLSEKNEHDLNSFLLSYKKSDKLHSLGIDIPNTIIMYGPPGCGKTMCANYIANKLNLPLIVARLDSMISSYLGTTSKNIRNLFEYAQKTPCVLFLDEFDAIAKARDDNNELGELKRVVNSLLQNIDSLGGNTLLIAATNHEELLDKAIWRRFNYKLKIDFPDYESRKKIINLFIKDIITLNDKELDILTLLTKGMSGAEIEQIITKSIQKSVIYEYELKLVDFLNEILDLKLGNDTQLDVKEKIKYLRELNEKKFSYSTLGEIFSLSKTKVSNLLKE
ncbi:AAA family ATPase [Clostridium perfringens]|uniref:AAA family ATPase n=1 Tax=Clostridium perfringens TaxID=1502 RepID=UPI000D717222|nr:ATP-binding protein [Clostridium perfringens]MDU2139794.1 ATP-binding protein [Streptococcus mitis]EGT0680524.1 AAA family ATPase [Clostridium perfringens]EJT6491884.1 AAA family ATPase [Clostridium perfringens]MDK0531424.1 ATP-binding protein [Clostridium perfringens]MDK0699780.1 ATP-binding protein [Clostridium perfringens]